jgi:hypothetical protein
VETLTDHGRCCFVGLLGYQPLTDGICDDVLVVIEGLASETVIELMQEEKRIKERYDSDKKMYTRKNQKNMTHRISRCVPKSIAGETTMKTTHEEVGIHRRYVCHKEMCIEREIKM